LSLELLARESGLGRYQLIRAFRGATGLTPHAYLLNARVNRGRQLLNQGQALAEVAYLLGFADQSHFIRVFKEFTNLTPKQYLRFGTAD
jgi:AraC-like DNA-binding protein